MTENHVLTQGDIVRLKQPYCPEEWGRLKPKDWRGFEFGIVVEIVSYQSTVNVDRLKSIAHTAECENATRSTAHRSPVTSKLSCPPG